MMIIFDDLKLMMIHNKKKEILQIQSKLKAAKVRFSDECFPLGGFWNSGDNETVDCLITV